LVVRSGLTSVAKRNLDKLPIKIDVIVVRNNLEFEPFLKKSENIILGVPEQNTTSYQQKQQQTTSSYQQNQQEEKKIYTTPYRVILTSPQPQNLSASTPQQKSEVKEEPAEDEEKKIKKNAIFSLLIGCFAAIASGVGSAILPDTHDRNNMFMPICFTITLFSLLLFVCFIITLLEVKEMKKIKVKEDKKTDDFDLIIGIIFLWILSAYVVFHLGNFFGERLGVIFKAIF
jgi:cation transport ATPase